MKFHFHICHWSKTPCFALGLAINVGKRLDNGGDCSSVSGVSIHLGLFFFRFGVLIGRENRGSWQPFKFLKLEKL